MKRGGKKLKALQLEVVKGKLLNRLAEIESELRALRDCKPLSVYDLIKENYSLEKEKEFKALFNKCYFTHRKFWLEEIRKRDSLKSASDAKSSVGKEEQM